MEPLDRTPATPFGGTSIATAERVTAFLRAVYGWMCAGLAITAVVAYMVAGSPALLQVLIGNQLLLFGLFIGQLALVFVLSARVDRLAPGTAAAIFVGYAALTGVIVFTGLTAYDAQRLKQMALALPQGQTGSYAIVGALSLYLDFLNLFLFLLRFLGDRRN